MNLRTDYKPFSLHPTHHVPEKEKGMSFWRRSLLKCQELFITYLPYSEFREYPPSYMFLAGSLLFAFLGVFFFSLFGYLFATNLSTVYLAPGNSGDSVSTCQEILSTNTGVFLGTEKGIWEGSNGFGYSEATFAMHASNWQLSKAGYASIMQDLFDGLSALKNAMLTQDLGINLLFWFTLTAFTDPADPVNRFSLIGDPSIALNRQNIFGTVSSVHGECKLVNQYASYDKANGLLILNIPHNDYINDPVCMAAGNPSFLGYNSLATANYFQVKVDVFSLVTAISLNLQLLPMKFLIEIPKFRKEIVFQGKTFHLSQYFNPKFPGMAPITCLVNVTCSLRLGPSNYAIPFFHHIGNSTINPDKCNCAVFSAEDKADSFHPCNLFSFLAGFIYFPASDASELFEFLISTPAATSFGASYPPSFVASAFGQKSPLYPVFNQQQNREKLFDFCAMKHGNCSMVTFTLFDTANPDWSLTRFYYQLTNGACQDTISLPKETW
jgi:hypothetical protein